MFQALRTSIRCYQPPSNLKFLFPALLSLLLVSCVSVHTQSLRDDAVLIVVQNPRVIAGEKYRPFVALNVNGKRVERTKENFERDPQTSYVEALIDPGKHKIKLEVTAYNGPRAKYNHITLELDLLPENTYHLFTTVLDIVSDDIKADSWAHLKLINVQNGHELLNEKIVLEDNGQRSVVEDPTIVVPIIL